MKVNPFNEDINCKIKNSIQKIIPKIKTQGKFVSVNNTGRDWKYNISEEYLNKCKKLFEINKESVYPVNEYLLGFKENLISNNLLSIIQEIYFDKKVTISGHFYYPNKGYMGWHTNWNQPNKRLYITYASEDKISFFRYFKNGEIVTCYDNKGITIREFDIPEPPNYFWHCVGSECDRYSFGFKIHLKPEIIQEEKIFFNNIMY